MNEQPDISETGQAHGREERPDPRVSTVPLETEDGEEVVIQQQNVGPRNQVGAGEFKRSKETAVQRDPGQAAQEQERLEAQAPIEDDGPKSAQSERAQSEDDLSEE